MELSYSSTFLSSEEMEHLFRETFDHSLAELGFQFVGKSRWVRETRAGFKHLFYFYPFRPGADYYPYGALSFDYTPRIEAGRIRLRTDAKHTRVHLVVTDIGFGTENAIARNRATAKRKCLELHSTLIRTIKTVLDPIVTVDKAVERFAREKAREATLFYHYPEKALAYAFTLAKATRKDEAESELNILLEKQAAHFPLETHAQIRQLLAQAMG